MINLRNLLTGTFIAASTSGQAEPVDNDKWQSSWRIGSYTSPERTLTFNATSAEIALTHLQSRFPDSASNLDTIEIPDNFSFALSLPELDGLQISYEIHRHVLKQGSGPYINTFAGFELHAASTALVLPAPPSNNPAYYANQVDRFLQLLPNDNPEAIAMALNNAYVNRPSIEEDTTSSVTQWITEEDAEIIAEIINQANTEDSDTPITPNQVNDAQTVIQDIQSLSPSDYQLILDEYNRIRSGDSEILNAGASLYAGIEAGYKMPTPRIPAFSAITPYARAMAGYSVEGYGISTTDSRAQSPVQINDTSLYGDVFHGFTATISVGLKAEFEGIDGLSLDARMQKIIYSNMTGVLSSATLGPSEKPTLSVGLQWDF